MDKPRILVVESDGLTRQTVSGYLETSPCVDIQCTTDSIFAAKDFLTHTAVDLIICAAVLQDGDVRDALGSFGDGYPVLILAAPDEQALAIEVSCERSCIYLVKDQEGRYLEALSSAIDRSLQSGGYGKDRDSDCLQVANSAKENDILYRQLVEHMGEGLAIADTEDNFIFANPAAERMLGIQPGKMVGRNLADFLDEESFQMLHNITDIRRDGITSSYEVRMRRDDGIWRDISITGTPHIELDGTFNGGMGILRDITYKKSMERELQEANETLEQKVKERTADLQAANELLQAENVVRRKLESHLRQRQKMEAVGTLAGGIAHDFNNLLFVITGNAELALAESGANGPGSDYLNSIVTASHRATHLVKQILTFARKSERQRELVEVAPIISEVLELMASALPSTIEIESDLRTTEVTVNADPTEIHQIVMNLCNNAGQSMQSDGGKLTVRLNRRNVSEMLIERYPALRPGVHAVITVCDSGVGITPELIDRIFEPFFTTKAVGKGTGMGLSVVHGIVTDLGGLITVTNNPDKGATFEVLLPVADAQVDQEPHDSQHVPGGQEHVMLVDDVDELSRMLAKRLSRVGYKVSVFSNGIEALAALRQSPELFQIILTDQTMPKMTGIELAREVKSLNLGVPVIMMTGNAQDLDDGKLSEVGIRACLSKPVNLDILASSIREAISSVG